MKRQKDRMLKEELPRSVDAQYATGDQWRNNFRRNEEMEPKQKYMTLKTELPRLVGAQYAARKTGEITPEIMKTQRQRKNNAQLWM